MAIVLNITFILSIIAFVFSAAAFTAMIIVSGCAALIAVAGIRTGYVRRGVLIIYFVLCAVLVSPVIFDVEPVGQWVAALSALGILASAILYRGYLRRQKVRS